MEKRKNSGVSCMENPMFLGRKIKNERKEKSPTAKDVYGGVGNIELANHEKYGTVYSSIGKSLQDEHSTFSGKYSS